MARRKNNATTTTATIDQELKSRFHAGAQFAQLCNEQFVLGFNSKIGNLSSLISAASQSALQPFIDAEIIDCLEPEETATYLPSVGSGETGLTHFESSDGIDDA